MISIGQRKYWIGIIISFLAYGLSTWLKSEFGTTGKWISWFIVFFSVVSIAITVVWRNLTLKHNLERDEEYEVDDDHQAGLVFKQMVIVAVLGYIHLAILFLYLLIIGLRQSEKDGGLLYSDKFFNRFILATIAVYIPVQLWFSASLINTVGSDENLINNDILQNASILFSSIGFGLLVARFIRLKGTNFFIPFLIASLAMYLSQEPIIDYWASKQSNEEKTSALIGLLAKSAIINQTGVPGESDSFKTPEKVRIELVYLPASMALSSEIGRYRQLVNNSSYVRTLARDARILTTQENYQKVLHEVRKAWETYPDYIKLAALTRSQETQASKFISMGQLQYDRPIVTSYFEKAYERSFTCSGKASAIIVEARKNVPRPFSLETALKTERGKTRFLHELQSNGLSLPRGWKFTNEQDLRRDLQTAICQKRDTLIDSFETKFGRPLLNNGRPYTAAEYMQLVTGFSNIRSLSTFDQDFFAREARRRVSNTAVVDIVNRIESTVDKNGNEWFKAAMMPAIGLTLSFVFIILNGVILVSGILREFSINEKVIKYLKTAFFASLFFLSNPNQNNLFEISLNLQEKMYRNTNYWFTTIGIPPKLSDQTEDYRSNMSRHHVKRAENALNQNLLTTPPSRSALFHVTMAKYYDTNAKTDDILSSMINRYIQLGAQNPESQLNERYNYIKKWRNVYL